MSELNEQLKTWPAEIWLQHGCDELRDYAEVRGNELTWCVDNINESDVRYVRADLATPAPQAAPSGPTELEHRLRETADQQPGWKPLLTAAADEIKRLRAAVTQAAPSEPVPLNATHGPLHLTSRKTADIVSRGYNIVGYVLRRTDGNEVCLSAESAVRWLPQPHYWRLMHEQDGSLFAAPASPQQAQVAPSDSQELLAEAAQALESSADCDEELDVDTNAVEYARDLAKRLRAVVPQQAQADARDAALDDTVVLEALQEHRANAISRRARTAYAPDQVHLDHVIERLDAAIAAATTSTEGR